MRNTRSAGRALNMVAWACDDSRCFTAETLHKTTIAAPCLEAWVSVWHGRSGDCLHTLPFAAAEPCYFLRASPVDAGVVASAGVTLRLGLWNARTAALLGEFPVRDVREDAEEERADVLDGAFAPDGRIALTDFNGALHFYGACADARLELAPSEQFFASELHTNSVGTCTATRRIRRRRCSIIVLRPVLCDAQLSPLDDAWQRQSETFVERPAGFDAEQAALERQARERQAIEEAEEGEAGAPALPPGGICRGTAAAAAAGSSSGAAGKRSVRPWWADAPGRRGGPAARGPPARNGPRGGGGASSSQLYRTGDELNAALNAAVGAASSDDDGVDDESDWSGLSGGARSRSDDDDDESGQSYESGDDGDELEVGGHALRGGGRRKQQARRIKRLRRGDEFGSSSEGWAASDDEDAARRRRRRRDDGDGGDARARATAARSGAAARRRRRPRPPRRAPPRKAARERGGGGEGAREAGGGGARRVGL